MPSRIEFRSRNQMSVVERALDREGSSLSKKKQQRPLGIISLGFLMLDLSLWKTSQLEILKCFADRGYEVYLFAAHSRNKFEFNNPRFHIISIPLRYVPVITPLFFAVVVIFFLLPFYLVMKRPRYIITDPGLAILSFVWKPLFRLCGARIVLDIRSTPVDVLGFRGSLSALWFNVSVLVGKNVFDGMTTLTCRMKQELCESFGIELSFVGVWTSGVSTELFDPTKYDEVDDLRRELSSEGKFVVMYHGSLSFNRGILETIKAFEIVRDRYPNILFLILGGGPGLSDMKKLALEIGVQEKVIFHDPVSYDKIPRFIKLVDLGIIPLPDLQQWRNQCSLKLLEYLAMGKVVIATDIPANRDVLGDCKCGILVPSAAPREIANAIVYAYNNRGMLEEWGIQGQAIIEKRYSWTRVANDFEEYLRQL